MTTAPAHPTIKQLLDDKRRETGWSYNEMAEAAGGTVTRAGIHHLMTNPIKSWPKSPETITGLARMLNVREDVVVLAYAASIGIPVCQPPSLLAAMLPDRTDLLTQAERTHIVGIINALTQDR